MTIKRIATAITTGALLLSTITPAFAGTTNVTITGNGRDSTNNATVTSTNTTTVSQGNLMSVTNNVNSNANSGANTVSDNAGDASIHTDSAKSNVQVVNSGNTNVAKVDPCGCDSNGSIDISKNLRGSDNDATVKKTNTTVLFQTNAAEVNNNVNSNANSGANVAQDNAGNVAIHSGSAKSNVGVATDVNKNFAILGGSGGAGGAGAGWSAQIVGNGRDSTNNIDLTLTNVKVLSQGNVAAIDNNVNSNANSGANIAEDNAGDATIHTLDAVATTQIFNHVNKNLAWVVDCGCVTDVNAKIGKNLRDSDSDIAITNTNVSTDFQQNVAYLRNNADTNGNSGANEVSDNTGGLLIDPSIHAGPAADWVSVDNSGNTNVLGNSLPGAGSWMSHFDWTWDMNGIWSW